MKWPYALCLLPITLPLYAQTDMTQQAGAPQISFNDLQYRLGYDVYLANKNLSAAWQVAFKAVSSEPTNTFWLQRFAQVSEWVGKPVEALDAWFKYAQATNDNTAWEAVGRLAESLYNDTILLVYQKRLVNLQPNNEAAILKLVQIYERLGEPNEGLVFLTQLASKSRANKTLLVAEAGLAERAGQDERAIKVYSQLINTVKPVDSTWLLRRASLWFQRGKVNEAWQSLHHIESQMPPRAAEYWHTYAELSRLLNKQDVAERAYQHLTNEFLFDSSDLINYGALQNESNPLNAAFIHELSYRLYKQDNAVIALLYAYQKANHPQGIHRFLSLLSEEELKRFEQNPLFLEQRAQFYWQQKQLLLAQHDYEHALALAPQQSRLLQGLVGVLTEQHRDTALKNVLIAADATAKRQAILWQTWSLAWLYLQQPQRALPFQQAYSQAHPQDSLGQLVLADTLAATGNTPLANTLRHRVWQQREPLLANETGERLQQLNENLFLLELNWQNAEQSQYSLSKWLIQHSKYRAFEHEVSLGWLLNHEYFDRAQQWITQHSPRATMPAWARLSMALQHHDTPALNALLNQQVEQLPIYDRIEAANQSNRPDLAESLAFNTQEHYPLDDELHRRYSDLLSARGHVFKLELSHQELGALGLQQQQLSWASPLAPLWRIEASLTQQQLKSLNSSILNTQLPNSQVLDVAWHYQHSQQTWQFALTQQNAWSNNTGWRIEHDYRLDNKLSVHWQWQQQQTSTESTGLMIAGTKNRWGAGFNWAITGREYLNTQCYIDDYLSQAGHHLGSGQLLQLEVGHRLFADQSDHVLKFNVNVGQFSTNATLDPSLNTLAPLSQTLTPDFFIPQSYQQIGVAWAFGQVNPLQYQRGVRWLGEFGLNHSDINGMGFNGRLGLQSPLFGNDSLRLEATHSRSGQQNGESSEAIHLNYRLFY